MTKYLCNICGKELDDLDRQAFLSFNRVMTYGSKHDGECIQLDLCCNCFDNLLDKLLPMCKHSPIVATIDDVPASSIRTTGL